MEVDRYLYLKLPFGARGLYVERMCEIVMVEGGHTISLLLSIGRNGGAFDSS